MNKAIRKSKGFTLIELLVVITVIAILAAILFPVYARVKAKAHQTVCLSNIKQLSLAAQMYSSDWGDRLPPNRTGGGWETWFVIMAPWNDAATMEVYPGCGSLGAYFRDPQLLVCPAWESDMWVWVKDAPLGRYRSYGNNDSAGGQLINNLFLPSQFIIIADTYNAGGENIIWYNPGDAERVGSGPSSICPAGYRHPSLGFNAGFADGHASFCAFNKYWNNSVEARKYWAPDGQVGAS